MTKAQKELKESMIKTEADDCVFELRNLINNPEYGITVEVNNSQANSFLNRLEEIINGMDK